MRISSCIGILLAGGLAHRMGGGDKVLRKIGGISLLAHAAPTLRPQCADLVLSANGDQARFAGLDMPVVADNVPGFKGPLAGILAGLDWIAVHYRAVRLAISVPARRFCQPTSLSASLTLAPDKTRCLPARVRATGRIRPSRFGWPIDPYDPFFNVNYPSDLAAAEAILSRCNKRSA